jgi:copper chaperone
MGMERLSLKIEGMTCGHCVSRVAGALNGVPGVEVEAIGGGNAAVRYDPALASVEELRSAVAGAGYGVGSVQEVR